MGAFVGLDVSLASVAICVVDGSGRVVWVSFSPRIGPGRR
jgi:hypothetical protein